MAAHRSEAFDSLPDAEIQRLVESLNSLHEGELGVSMLAACGQRAIGPLRDFLLHGRPAGVSQPRQRAVRALAELGAKDVLLEYLRASRRVADPVVRLGEEAVENTAARALAKWQTEDVFQELLYVASKRPLSGVIETLATFHRVETVPYFVSALEDDVGRRPAQDALRRLGAVAWPALVETARTPDPSRQCESPSSLRRRQSALEILADADLPAQFWPKLQALLKDSDHEISTKAARIGLRIGDKADRQTAVTRLFEAVELADWFVKIEAEDCLVRHFDQVKDVIEAEITRRGRALPKEKWARDVLLSILVAVRERAARDKLNRGVLQ
ncbi:MAG: hypothetical protein ACE14M_06430 [Terriglobales bacterium]